MGNFLGEFRGVIGGRLGKVCWGNMKRVLTRLGWVEGKFSWTQLISPQIKIIKFGCQNLSAGVG